MKKTLLAAALLAALPALADDLLPEARKVATTVPPKLLAVLTAEIGKSGPEGAIGVCREQAPQMAKAASEQTGWSIRRVSLNNRNPKAVPDAWNAPSSRTSTAGRPPASRPRRWKRGRW